MSLIVIEGLDGSGKETQSRMLYDHLTGSGVETTKITFPDYESPSSSLVKMYLGGEFGTDPSSVNAYAASSFYAVDRFASYSTKWKDAYCRGDVVLADRYTTSNIVYQLSKLDRSQWDTYIDWVVDFEFVKMGLPVPDVVIYLDMSPEVSQKLLSRRYNGDESKKDIHESHKEFLAKCRESAVYAAGKFSWCVIPCSADGEPRSLEDIHKDVVSALIDKGIIKE